MAATTLPVQTLAHGGVTRNAEVAADAVNGNVLATNNGTTTWIDATNTDTASHTLTLVTPGHDSEGNAVADKVITLAASQKWSSGPLPISVYGANPQFTVDSALVTVAGRQI